MKEIIKYIIVSVISILAFAIALYLVSLVPEGTPGIFNQNKETDYTIILTEQQVISEVPTWIFDDPEIVMEITLATPSQAIEEPLKAKKEEPTTQEPKMTYFGVMATTGYVATGNPCADGNYPSVGWTVACNDSRLWHKKIYIEGIGTRYVHDTGGMASSVLDVFVGSVSEAYSITSRGRKVYIVEE